MNKKSKQIVTAITANVLLLPPIYYALLHGYPETDWIIVSLSCLPLLIVLGILRLVWGPDIYSRTPWQEEGFSGFREWFAKSRSFDGKLFRLTIKFFLPVLIGISILALIVVGILD